VNRPTYRYVSNLYVQTRVPIFDKCKNKKRRFLSCATIVRFRRKGAGRNPFRKRVTVTRIVIRLPNKNRSIRHGYLRTISGARFFYCFPAVVATAVKNRRGTRPTKRTLHDPSLTRFFSTSFGFVFCSSPCRVSVGILADSRAAEVFQLKAIISAPEKLKGAGARSPVFQSAANKTHAATGESRYTLYKREANNKTDRDEY